MKSLASIFLFLFIAFIVTPTIVTLIKHNADVSFVFNYNEDEENSGETGEKKSDEFQSKLIPESNLTSFILEENITSFGDYYVMPLPVIYFDLLSPPPEFA